MDFIQRLDLMKTLREDTEMLLEAAAVIREQHAEIARLRGQTAASKPILPLVDGARLMGSPAPVSARPPLKLKMGEFCFGNPRARVGDTLVVEFEEQVSRGFSWSVSGVTALQIKRAEGPSSGGLRTVFFNIQAAAPGKYVVDFLNSRPGVIIDPPQARVALTVEP